MVYGATDVVSTGNCIGCGVCPLVSKGRISVELTASGIYQAKLDAATPEDLELANKVCPVSDTAMGITELSSKLFPNLPSNTHIGSYHAASAGRVSDPEKILESSSGGLTAKFVEELLRQNVVDSIIHVGPTQTGGELFSYRISRTAEEASSNRKSAYYSTSLEQVLLEAKKSKERFAIVGVPCFIKAVRLLALQDEDLAGKVVFYVGIVCGHLKSQLYAQSLAWQAGVSPEHVKGIDFRVKTAGSRSSEYSFEVSQSTGAAVRMPTSEALDSNWGYAAFQPSACDYCDDIFAETADVVFGDAWLERYIRIEQGTNLVLSRSEKASSILNSLQADGSIFLEGLPIDDLVLSQAGNFRHRREGLKIRLKDDILAGTNVPVRRVEATYSGSTLMRRLLIRQRRRLSRLSFRAFYEAKEKDSLSFYTKSITPQIRFYKALAFLDQNPKSIAKNIARILIKTPIRRIIQGLSGRK